MLNLPVFFAGMEQIKRGYYEIHFKKIMDPPFDSKGFEITEAYNKMLEEEIKKQPGNWLWSHRRWKHKK